MNKLLVTFGDSWTFGSELDRPKEQNWTKNVADRLNCNALNYSVPASSIGHLMVQLFNYINDSAQYINHKKIFMVGLTGSTRYLTYSNAKNQFVNITPEANYCTLDIHPSGRPPETLKEFNNLSQELYKMVQCTEYDTFLMTQVIFTFQHYCKVHNIDVIFFSYFDWLSLDANIVDTSIVYPTSITHALTGLEYSIPNIRDNVYFEGKLFHPNMLGHQKISEILYEFYTKKY